MPTIRNNISPVLFLPGTRGSFKTVRSLASAQDYFQHHDSPSDFFAVDFNQVRFFILKLVSTKDLSPEEGNYNRRDRFGEKSKKRSGFCFEENKFRRLLLSAVTLLSAKQVGFNSTKQALSVEFLSLVIDAILSLYTHSNSPPKSVIVVGHSLGVLAAARLLSDDRFDRTKITTVISLAGPLLDPIYSPGPAMDRVYAKVSAYFKKIANDPNNSLLIVSLTGGSRDFLVPDVLGVVDYHSPGLHVLWLSTSSISRVWASCDHLCILWCRQLMHSLTFAVQDLKAISSAIDQLNVSTRLQVFRDRLTTRFIRLKRPTFILPGPTLPQPPIALDRLPPAPWVFLTGQLNFRYTGILSPEGQFTKIGPFFQDAEQWVLITTNRVFHEWLFLCTGSKRSTSSSNADRVPCPELMPLAKQDSSGVIWVPDHDSAFPRGLALLTLSHKLPSSQSSSSGLLQPGSYLVLAHPPLTSGSAQIELIVETFTDPSKRVQSLTETSVLWHRPVSVYIERQTPVHSSSDSPLSVFHRIYFPSTHFLFGPSFPAPRLIVTSLQCSVDTYDRGLVALFAPWANYFYHTFVRHNASAVLDLDVPIPPRNSSVEDSLFVDLLLKPYCTYNISVHLSLFQWIAKGCTKLKKHSLLAYCIVVSGAGGGVVDCTKSIAANKFSSYWVSDASGNRGLVSYPIHCHARIQLFRLHWAHLFGLVCGHLWLELWLLACLQLFRCNGCKLSKLIPEQRKGELQTSLHLRFQSLIPCNCWLRGAPFEMHFEPLYSILSSLRRFCLFRWSDWDRLYSHDYLGLRYADSELRVQMGISIPFSTRLIAHLAFLVLAVPISLVMPTLIRLLVGTISLTMRTAVYCSRIVLCQHRGLSMKAHSLSHGLLTLSVFFIGLVTCEALGVILLAGHMFFTVYTSFYAQLACDGCNAPLICATPSSTDKTRKDSNDSSAIWPPLFSFYWHCVLLIMIVMDSLFLVENWMDFAQSIDRYHNTGYQHITLLFHGPASRTDWYATVVLFTTALTDWSLVKLCSRKHISSGDLSIFQCIPSVVFFACSALCAVGLFHTALMGYRLALFSSVAIQLLLIGAIFHSTCASSSNSQSFDELAIKSKAE
ncbi:hypothetical protein FGIG_09327 [Fasciola gigantica]|uniref:GPI inositol-deacylase n=1 Tax=Fasciola gigantica TaxID=46835 RepID=A0A504Z7W8_FASGI|nr:hypothetical protein FGIG_09327 [Fasciola gigantica]